MAGADPRGGSRSLRMSPCHLRSSVLGFDAQFGSQVPTGLGVDGERVRAAAAAVQGEHQQPGQPFPQRVFGEPRTQFRDHVDVVAQREPALQPGLLDGPTPLVQSGETGQERRFHDDVGQNRPAPQRQRPVQPFGGQRQIATGHRLPALVSEPFELEHVEFVGRHRQPVPTRYRGQPVEPQPDAQRRNVSTQHPPGRRWRPGGPQRVDQAVGRHGPVGVQQQRSQQHPLLGRAETGRAAGRVAHLQRAQHPEPHPTLPIYRPIQPRVQPRRPGSAQPPRDKSAATAGLLASGCADNRVVLRQGIRHGGSEGTPAGSFRSARTAAVEDGAGVGIGGQAPVHPGTAPAVRVS